jgi:hypothetical protein
MLHLQPLITFLQQHPNLAASNCSRGIRLALRTQPPSQAVPAAAMSSLCPALMLQPPFRTVPASIISRGSQPPSRAAPAASAALREAIALHLALNAALALNP